MVATRRVRLCYISAKFAPHPNCLPLAELEGKMPLAADEVLLYPRRRRYIIVWGTGLPVPFVMGLPALTGRTTAINVSAQYETASEKMWRLAPQI